MNKTTPRAFINLIVFFLLAMLQLPNPAHAEQLTAEQWQVPLINQQTKTTLDSYKGQVIWIDFWASWCVPCRVSLPWLEKLQHKYGKDGLKVIAINVDENTQDAADFLEWLPLDLTIFFDSQGTTPEIFSVIGMPTSVLIDRQGKIVSKHVGFRESERNALEKELLQALSS